VRHGFRVRLRDIAPEPVQAGLAKVRETFAALEKKKRLTRRESANHLAAITATTSLDGFGDVGVVIEAVVEDLEIKKKVFREIEARVPREALLASNTSSLSIAEMQRALEHPERFLGLHFFNPVERMPLVEVVVGPQTADEAAARAEALARRLGKLPIRVKDGPGFVVNRLLSPYLNEAARLFEEGCTPAAVDVVLREFGMPVGPFELLDEVGLDVAAKVAGVLHAAFGARAAPPETLGRILAVPGLRGKKTGKGFYLHSRKGGKPSPNPEVLRFQGPRREPQDPPEVWVKRLIYPMIDEAARVLEERIVERPSDVDLAMVLGTGFPPFRGGLLRHADTVGVGEVIAFLQAVSSARRSPCDLLLRLKSEGANFYSLERETVGALT
jgi:3-hydroxyacyl-CoA dehydrogenase/enoyl-CoA hydratase/3-hydroxybutyryl-CoA epimerase